MSKVGFCVTGLGWAGRAPTCTSDCLNSHPPRDFKGRSGGLEGQRRQGALPSTPGFGLGSQPVLEAQQGRFLFLPL